MNWVVVECIGKDPLNPIRIFIPLVQVDTPRGFKSCRRQGDLLYMSVPQKQGINQIQWGKFGYGMNENRKFTMVQLEKVSRYHKI